MKYWIILAFLTVSCVTGPEEEKKIAVKYIYGDTPYADITYCNNGLHMVFDTIQWEKTVYLEEGDAYCLAVEKTDLRNNLSMNISVYINGVLEAAAKDQLRASLQGTISF